MSNEKVFKGAAINFGLCFELRQTFLSVLTIFDYIPHFCWVLSTIDKATFNQSRFIQKYVFLPQQCVF